MKSFDRLWVDKNTKDRLKIDAAKMGLSLKEYLKRLSYSKPDKRYDDEFSFP